MKTRTVISLLCALSFLILSAGSGSAQPNPLYPYAVALSFDSARITSDLNQTMLTPDTIRGSMQDMSGLGAAKMTINITTATQWVILTKVGGNIVHDGDVINLTSNQILPIEVIIFPYADRQDTESYCMTLSLSPTYLLNHQCISLVTISTTSAVRTDQPIPNVILEPNPAGTYIFARGLNDMQAGYRYEIFSILGAEVRNGMLPADARLNVQDLPSGAYRLLLFDAKHTLTNTTFTVLH
ncbi:MAG TPA: T9SS type A sorting domain-containing protein [Candidatus Kapabacteria bacterium]|jgi:hypothetical protein|nr:T9SS type A sorting domain-containing protein [Candidatus Kapabacteria bacterium]